MRYVDGTPAAGVTAILYDETQRGMMQFQSDAAGRLALPQVPGWGAELFLPDAAPGTSVRRSYLFGDTPPPATVTLAQVASGTTQDGTVQRVFGNGERDSRYNILFVAEGYTDERETFEDRNGNGVWDGVLWVDVNGNDVYDANTDWYTTYGNAAVPSGNTVPGADNEPFTDLNGDGALSLDDRALFLENSHVFLRSLLGSDYWSEHRDMFNAYALFAPSPQAGYDLIDEDQTTILLERDTLYGAGVELDRSTIELDRNAAIQQALHALPEVDVVVVLVNQPVSAGRANVTFGGSGPGVMVYYGGVQETSPNGIVQSHEMGHFVGALCDEYDEFPGQHPQSGTAGPGCANSSYRHEREHLPWGDLVAADASLPTLDIDGSTTAVIGSSYYNDGAYRPTFNSTMRYNSPFFNEPSRRALAANTCVRTQGDLGCGTAIDDELRTATWWDPAESGWGLFTIDQGNLLAPGWFTYDLDGEPTW
ncbi:MAG TPA: M64 family metallopeptidase, partial [Tahibacter sp.]|nr:M64 family metallopeptidase [Tahibacter sp.]